MKLRYARHTNDLKKLVDFYTQIVGLEILGEFKDHEQYNGVFLGIKDLDWHLEFTSSREKANHHPDPDDLLVLYLHSETEFRRIKAIAIQKNLGEFLPKNPYWQNKGICLKDPDGFGVLVVVTNS